jgi:phosphoribosylanthranilate isomerase
VHGVTLVKVCGVNRPDDLAVAVEAGADLIGFILVDWSPRAITRDAAAELAAQVPAGVGRVGVFVDEDPATVAAIADELDLDYVQLHGSEAPPVVESFGHLAIKAHRLPKVGDLYGTTILLDRHFDAAPTAEELREHWAVARRLGASRRVLLAGALDAANVAAAIRAANPWAVDGVRGTESAPGVKDHDRIRAFVKAAKEASR